MSIKRDDFDYMVTDTGYDRLAVNKDNYSLKEAVEIACLEFDLEDLEKRDFIVCVCNGYVRCDIDPCGTVSSLDKWSVKTINVPAYDYTIEYEDSNKSVSCYLIHIDTKDEIFSTYKHEREKGYMHFRPIFDGDKMVDMEYIEVNLKEITLYEL